MPATPATPRPSPRPAPRSHAPLVSTCAGPAGSRLRPQRARERGCPDRRPRAGVCRGAPHLAFAVLQVLDATAIVWPVCEDVCRQAYFAGRGCATRLFRRDPALGCTCGANPARMARTADFGVRTFTSEPRSAAIGILYPAKLHGYRAPSQ